jgi:hypothetical protein
MNDDMVLTVNSGCHSPSAVQTIVVLFEAPNSHPPGGEDGDRTPACAPSAVAPSSGASELRGFTWA